MTVVSMSVVVMWMSAVVVLLMADAIRLRRHILQLRAIERMVVVIESGKSTHSTYNYK